MTFSRMAAASNFEPTTEGRGAYPTDCFQGKRCTAMAAVGPDLADYGLPAIRRTDARNKRLNWLLVL